MKTKKYSLPYWVKQNTRFVSQPENVLLEALKIYVERASDGGHPSVDFSGSPLEFINALYLEWRKRHGALPGFFPTPLDVALRTARSLRLQPGQLALDPGCGFGNLMWAVRECGGEAAGIEIQVWVHQVAQVLGFNVQYGDFVGNPEYGEPGCEVPPFDAVITNPSYGRVFGSKDAALDFMVRIADLAKPGTRVAAILPADYMTKDKPKAHAAMCQRYRILEAERLDAGVFKPLTCIATTRYLLVVVDGKGLAFGGVGAGAALASESELQASTDLTSSRLCEAEPHAELPPENAPPVAQLWADLRAAEAEQKETVARLYGMLGKLGCLDGVGDQLPAPPAEAQLDIPRCPVPADLFDQAAANCQVDIVATRRGLVLDHLGQQWVCVAGDKAGALVVRVVRRGAWTGEILEKAKQDAPPAECYRGLLIQGHETGEWVMTGDQVAWTRGAAPSLNDERGVLPGVLDEVRRSRLPDGSQSVEAVWRYHGLYWICTGLDGDKAQMTRVVLRAAAEDLGVDCAGGQTITCGKHEYLATADHQQVTFAPDPQSTALVEPVRSRSNRKSNTRPRLPEGIPALVEVDMGRSAGWVQAEVIRADKRFLYCRVDGTARKLALAGRGVTWRPGGNDVSIPAF